MNFKNWNQKKVLEIVKELFGLPEAVPRLISIQQPSEPRPWINTSTYYFWSGVCIFQKMFSGNQCNPCIHHCIAWGKSHGKEQLSKHQWGL